MQQEKASNLRNLSFLFFYFLDWVSLRSSGWFWTHRDPLTSASWVLGLKKKKKKKTLCSNKYLSSTTLFLLLLLLLLSIVCLLFLSFFFKVFFTQHCLAFHRGTVSFRSFPVSWAQRGYLSAPLRFWVTPPNDKTAACLSMKGIPSSEHGTVNWLSLCAGDSSP